MKINIYWTESQGNTIKALKNSIEGKHQLDLEQPSWLPATGDREWFSFYFYFLSEEFNLDLLLSNLFFRI